MKIAKVSSYNMPVFQGKKSTNKSKRLMTIPAAVMLVSLNTLPMKPAQPAENMEDICKTEMLTGTPKTKYYTNRLNSDQYLLKKAFNYEGKEHTMVFQAWNQERSATAIQYVLILPCDLDPKMKPENGEYMIKELIIHKVNNGNWVEARGSSNYVPEKNSYYYKSIKLPDDLAQELVDLLANDSRFINKTHITYSFTNSNTMKPPEYVKAKSIY